MLVLLRKPGIMKVTHAQHWVMLVNYQPHFANLVIKNIYIDQFMELFIIIVLLYKE